MSPPKTRRNAGFGRSWKSASAGASAVSGAAGAYHLPEDLARHAPDREFVPDELREVCLRAGEELGREHAGCARFLSAAEMVASWRGAGPPGLGGTLRVARRSSRLPERSRESSDLRDAHQGSDSPRRRSPLGKRLGRKARRRPEQIRDLKAPVRLARQLDCREVGSSPLAISPQLSTGSRLSRSSDSPSSSISTTRSSVTE